MRHLGLDVHRDRPWFDQRARLHALQAVDDHALLRLQARGHDAQATRVGAERDFAVRRLVVVADDDRELLVLVGADRALADQQRRTAFDLAHAQPRELARDQAAVGVVEHRTHAHRAALGVDLVVNQL